MAELTPAEHDERLLELERALRAAERAVEARQRALRLGSGQRRRGGAWVGSDGLPATLDDAVATGSAPNRLEALNDATAELIRARMAISTHESTYEGWSRFRLVVSSDGHVHASDTCRSFRKTTQTVVIPSLSGKTPEDAVAMLGSVCCSVCMPGVTKSTVKIPSAAVNVLVKRGTAAFEAYLARRKTM